MKFTIFAKMITGSLLMVAVVLIGGTIILVNLHLIITSFSDLTENDQQLIIDSKNLQIQFKTQIQEWKNILLRGKDPKSYAKYKKQFLDDYQGVQDHIKKLRKYEQSTEDLAILDKFKKEHQTLQKHYLKALEIYDKTLDFAQADHHVRGMDRPVKRLMDKYSNLNEKHVTEQTTIILSHARTVRDYFIIGLIVVIIIFIIIAIIFARIISKPIILITHMVDDIAQGEGDLTQRINLRRNDEIGDLATGFNTFIEKLQVLVKRIIEQSNQLVISSENLSAAAVQMFGNSQTVQQKTNSIASASEEMTVNVENVANSSTQTSNNINSVTATVEELGANINSIAAATEEAAANMSTINENIKQISADAVQVASSTEEMSVSMSGINDKTKEAVEMTTKANESAQNTMDSMIRLEKTAGEIDRIVKMVEQIASQTNMLALNATIEAAGAGASGKGFAVVANEVKKLAQQTAKANNEIAKQVQTIQAQTNDSLKETEAVNQIIQQLSEINRSIGLSIEEQNRGAQGISISIESIANASKESTISVTESDNGLIEISRSVSEASQAAQDAAKSVSLSAEGVNEIARATGESSKGISEMNKNIQSIRQSTLEVAGGIQQTRENSKHLSDIAKELSRLVSAFNV